MLIKSNSHSQDESVQMYFFFGENSNNSAHCKPEQDEAAYIEYGNGAVAMQVSQVNLSEQFK